MTVGNCGGEGYTHVVVAGGWYNRRRRRWRARVPLDGTGIKSDAGTDYAAAAIDSTTGWRDGRGGN